MKRTPPDHLNKEKIIFIALALVFSVGVYRLLATQPLPLQSNAAMAARDLPSPVQLSTMPAVRVEGAYLSGKRPTPFRPGDWTRVGKLPVIPKEPPWIPPQPPRDVEETASNIERPVVDLRTRGFEYMGVVSVGGISCALLRTKDSATPHRLMPGEQIAGLEFRVTRIEQQAVWLTDGQSVSVLKNERFAAPVKALTPQPAERGVPMHCLF